MKKLKTLLSIITLFISSCSPPIEERGTEFINEFSQSIYSIENTDAMNDIAYELNSAIASISQDKEYFISNEDLDEKQIALLDRITKYDTIPRYIELTHYLDARNQTVLKFAEGTTWLCQNENPKKQLGLLRIEDGQITLLNRHKSYEIKYDEKLHSFINEIDDEFLLDNIDGDLIVYFNYENPFILKEATPQEKTMGNWVGKITYYGETTKLNLKLNENGSGTISTINGSYSIFSIGQNGNSFYFKEKGGEKYSFTLKENKLYLTSPYKITFSRTDTKQSIEFADIFNKPEFTQPSTSTNATSNNTSNASMNNNGDWDKMLDDYEDYIDQYIILYKKAIKGDQSAILEYPQMLAKASSLQSSMLKAQGNNQLSVKQLNRLSTIIMKMNEVTNE
jgi:hypothetical protein